MAWAVFNWAKEVWNDEDSLLNAKEKRQSEILFPIREENKAYGRYFTGKSYLVVISNNQVTMFNVTFESKCRNNWHMNMRRNSKNNNFLDFSISLFIRLLFYERLHL